jgi:hypothetical protein
MLAAQLLQRLSLHSVPLLVLGNNNVLPLAQDTAQLKERIRLMVRFAHTVCMHLFTVPWQAVHERATDRAPYPERWAWNVCEPLENAEIIGV